MNFPRNETAYGLGKRAYKANSDNCDAMNDPLFVPAKQADAALDTLRDLQKDAQAFRAAMEK